LEKMTEEEEAVGRTATKKYKKASIKLVVFENWEVVLRVVVLKIARLRSGPNRSNFKQKKRYENRSSSINTNSE